MSSLPSFLDLPAIQSELASLGHSVDLSQVQNLLLELGFGEPADVATEISAADNSYAQVLDPPAPSSHTSSEVDAVAFTWQGRSTQEQPGLTSLLSSRQQQPAYVDGLRRTALSNATNSPTAASPGKHASAVSKSALASGAANHENCRGAGSLPYPTTDDDIAQLKAAAGTSFPSLSQGAGLQAGGAEVRLRSSRQDTLTTTYTSGQGHKVTTKAARVGSYVQPAAERRRSSGLGRPSTSTSSIPAAAGKQTGASSGSSKPRKKADPVSTYQAMKKLWAKDKFLKAGGDGKTLRRKTEGFRQLFSTLHAIEAAKR